MGTLLSFIHPNLEITYGSEPFRTFWDWSKGRTEPLEPMYIGSVQFSCFCGLAPVWTSSKPNRGNTNASALCDSTSAMVCPYYNWPVEFSNMCWSHIPDKRQINSIWPVHDEHLANRWRKMNKNQNHLCKPKLQNSYEQQCSPQSLDFNMTNPKPHQPTCTLDPHHPARRTRNLVDAPSACWSTDNQYWTSLNGTSVPTPWFVDMCIQALRECGCGL